MEIRELNLAAFGPFTDRTLVFDQEAGGLHIVYGPNEAGKSSALRGLKALLYGISERAADNFIHPNNKLRVGGCLRATGERELTFVRRKGRKNTLLTATGEPLDDTALIAFLQGVSAELFETLFGIDHSALVRGGQEILEQKGEVGQALFAAALGSTALHTVLETLDKEADGLFRPRGSTQEVNTALKAYSDIHKEMRGVSLSSHKWDEHRRALARATKDLKQVQAGLAKSRAAVTRLKRIQRILPKLARRADLVRKLEDFSDVVVLSAEFGERRQAAIKELDKAKAVDRKATSRLRGLQDQLAGIEVRQEVLGQAEAIEAIHERLGSHRKAMQDRPHLEAERSQLLTDAESLLKDIRPGLALSEIEVLRPSLARRVRIADLGNQRQALIARVKQTETSARETKKRLEDALCSRQQLPEIGSTEALRSVVTAARKMGDLNGAIVSTDNELQQLEQQCAADLARLSLWSGSLSDIPSLAVPARESVDRFEQAYEALDKRAERLREKRQELADGMRELDKQLDEIQRTGALPTEQNLNDVRSQRDLAWRLLRRQWVDGEDVEAQARAFDPEHALADAFETRMAGADETADRLRREADRVHKQASLLAGQTDHKQKIKEIETQLNDCADERARLDDDWWSLWRPCRIEPRTPREMRAWLEGFERLREKVGQLGMHRRKVAEVIQDHDAHVQALRQQLSALGKDVPSSVTTLEAVLAVGEDVVAEIDEIQRRHKQLQQDIETLERDLESVRSDHQSARAELDEWKAQWQGAVEELGLGLEALPSEANDIIEKLRALFSKHNEAEKLRIRIQGIDEDAEAFRARVNGLITQAAPELADLSVEQAGARLNALLMESRSTESRRQQIEQQVQQAREEIQDAGATIATMTDRLKALCADAKCNEPDELDTAQRQSDEYQQLKTALAGVERELLEAGEGATLAELEKEAEGIDADAQPGQIQELTRAIATDLEPRQSELANSKGREEKELELMDGGDRAAQLADEAQGILAHIRANAQRYVRVKLAARVLRNEIERYRKENQGPLVKRASEHFAVLTRGSFEGLRTYFNDKDEPVLVGVRPEGGQRVHVEGMSSGTRDQLYLALRLASLEKYMESSEPMPFIVDDILVDFDDERSEAALSALAELAQKAQVILFTHHSRVVEQAHKLLGKQRVHIHDL